MILLIQALNIYHQLVTKLVNIEAANCSSQTFEWVYSSGDDYDTSDEITSDELDVETIKWIERCTFMWPSENVPVEKVLDETCSRQTMFHIKNCLLNAY